MINDLIVLLNAGTITTSHALTSSLYYSKKHPDKSALVIEEVNRVVGNGSLEDVSFAKFHDMEKFN